MPDIDKQDEAVQDSFPASDPPATSGITGTGKGGGGDAESSPQPDRSDGEARPKGYPTSDRHATETAYQAEDQEHPKQDQAGSREE